MREFQVLFFTHTGAIRFERKLKGRVASCVLMPVPRALSSNCSVSAHVRHNGDLDALIDEQVEKVFEQIDSNFRLIYESE